MTMTVAVVPAPEHKQMEMLTQNQVPVVGNGSCEVGPLALES